MPRAVVQDYAQRPRAPLLTKAAQKERKALAVKARLESKEALAPAGVHRCTQPASLIAIGHNPRRADPPGTPPAAMSALEAKARFGQCDGPLHALVPEPGTEGLF